MTHPPNTTHPMIRPLRLPAEPSPPAHAALPHILLLLDQFPKALGGGERIVLRLAELLPHYGFRPSILTLSVHPESGILSSVPPCPIFLLPLSRTYDMTALRSAFALRRFIQQEKVVLVQTFFESSDLWGGLVVKSLTQAKLIWSRRDMGILRQRKHRLAYRRLASLPDKVFAVSERVRRYSIEVDRIPAHRVQTIYNGLDLSLWHPAPPTGHDAQQFVIATVGNIRHIKGHDVLLEAAALVVQRFPQVSFTIAGEVLEPAFFAQLQQRVRELGLSPNFAFLGGIDDLREHLQTADIFVLPSRSEGFSNAIIEAMACGLPLIATDVGGNSEAVQNGLNGFIVPPEDPRELAEAILRLLDNPAEAKRMGQSGALLVTANFTSQAMMSRITQSYAALLSQ